MNNRATLAARSLTTLFVGFLFWSWGARRWRTLQMQGMAPYPRVMPKPEAAKLAPALKSVSSDRAKLDVTRRLSDAVKDPAKLTASDIAAAKATWGSDAAKMLSVLKDSSR